MRSNSKNKCSLKIVSFIYHLQQQQKDFSMGFENAYKLLSKIAPILRINFFFTLHKVSYSYKGKMTTATTKAGAISCYVIKSTLLYPYKSYRV